MRRQVTLVRMAERARGRGIVASMRFGARLIANFSARAAVQVRAPSLAN